MSKILDLRVAVFTTSFIEGSAGFSFVLHTTSTAGQEVDQVIAFAINHICTQNYILSVNKHGFVPTA